MIMCATPLKENGILCVYHRDHPYITSAKGLVRWGRKMAIFAEVHFCGSVPYLIFMLT
jgi:hypothetical protein